ncbi:MAG: hypothetical protein IT462_15070 [Planctomycetes bacterium]|nr:hypothetical protein [Planctomycetota bacterium]
MRRLLILGCLLLSACGGGIANNNAHANNAGANKACGIKFEREPLEERPVLDPFDLWPPDGARMASENFWGIWQTSEHDASRMLLSTDGLLWHAFGDSTAVTHDRLVDLAQFTGSRVKFSVEFNEKGTAYRSRPRTVSFGRGAHFKDREVHMFVEPRPDQRKEVDLVGGDPRAMADDFQIALSPREMKFGIVPLEGDDKGGKVLLYVDGTTVPEKGAVLFLQIHDRRSETLDRLKIVVRLR